MAAACRYAGGAVAPRACWDLHGGGGGGGISSSSSSLGSRRKKAGQHGQHHHGHGHGHHHHHNHHEDGGRGQRGSWAAAVAALEGQGRGEEEEGRGEGGVLLTPMEGSELRPAAAAAARGRAKITVVGVGNVGMACAQTCLTSELMEELVLVDVQPGKVRGEVLDLQHAAAFLPRVDIVGASGGDYGATAGSDVCIIAAGARQREGESRLDLLGRNAGLMRAIVPELVRRSPDAVLLVVSNPVDVLAHLAWRLSGLAPGRVLGAGTNLDSSRLRFLVAAALAANAHNVHGYVVGEHGDSSVPLWSGLAVAGVPVLGLGPFPDAAALDALHRAVVGSAHEVIRLKGYTSWAIGYSAASLVRSILRDQRRIHPVSVLARGFYGIPHPVFLSLPSQLGRAGVLGVAAHLPLSPDELRKLRRSADTIWDTQRLVEGGVV